jgi:hypothetical protein
MEIFVRKLNLDVRMEKSETLPQLINEELYKSLRESYQTSIYGSEETFCAREVIKGLLAKIVFVVFIVMLSSFQVHAFNAVEEGKAISDNPELIYTMYLGMPRSEIDYNFSNIKGWGLSNSRSSFLMKREYSDYDVYIHDAHVKENIMAIFDEKDYIKEIGSGLYTDKLSHAVDIYHAMFQNMLNRYGDPQDFSSPRKSVKIAIWDVGNHTYRLALTDGYMYPYKYGVMLYVRPLDTERKMFNW